MNSNFCDDKVPAGQTVKWYRIADHNGPDDNLHSSKIDCWDAHLPQVQAPKSPTDDRCDSLWDASHTAIQEVDKQLQGDTTRSPFDDVKFPDTVQNSHAVLSAPTLMIMETLEQLAEHGAQKLEAVVSLAKQLRTEIPMALLALQQMQARAPNATCALQLCKMDIHEARTKANEIRDFEDDVEELLSDIQFELEEETVTTDTFQILRSRLVSLLEKRLPRKGLGVHRMEVGQPGDRQGPSWET
jgi:type I site-specific restriction endonuclease